MSSSEGRRFARARSNNSSSSSSSDDDGVDLQDIQAAVAAASAAASADRARPLRNQSLRESIEMGPIVATGDGGGGGDANDNKRPEAEATAAAAAVPLPLVPVRRIGSSVTTGSSSHHQRSASHGGKDVIANLPPSALKKPGKSNLVKGKKKGLTIHENRH